MIASKYLIEKIARHGTAAQRLIDEQDQNRGEFLDLSEISATAFGAAEFVWTCLALRGEESVQESRYIRNHVAEAIIKALEEVWPLDAANEPSSVFENDGSALGLNQSDGFKIYSMRALATPGRKVRFRSACAIRANEPY